MAVLNKSKNVIFVVGTDTGVGKTVLSLLLMNFFFARGYNPFYLKPLQTGCRDPYDMESDARFIYRSVENLRDKNPADSVIYCFKNPKAPLFAARDEGKTIDLGTIEQIAKEKAATYTPLIIEGAGGLFAPVDGNRSVADLISLTKAQPIVAARAGLGTINHTLLTIEALKLRGFVPSGVVFIDAGKNETPAEMIDENRAAVEDASGVKVAGVIGRIDDFSSPPPAFYDPLMQIFG